MKNITRRSAIALPLLSLSNLTRAQSEWPNKPITLVVGFAPGGPNDIVARALAFRLSERLKHQVVVDNRPGANGNIAASIVARAKPDGYTFLYNSSSLALSSVLYRKSLIDPLRDLTAVNGTATLPLVCVVAESFPANSFREWEALLRANPGKFNYGSPGIGNLAHIAAAMVLKANGLSAVHAPYKGSSDALQGLLSGGTHFQFDSVNSPLPLIKSGKLKALFVTSSDRSPVLPDVPTLAQSGSPNVEASGWQGVMVAAKTPAPIVQRMAAEIANVMNSPEMTATISAQGGYVISTTPERYAAFLAGEIDRFKKTVDELNIQLD